MNGSFPYTSSWIGSLGEYPIYEYIKNSESTSSNFTINTSNTLETQITNTSKLIYKDNSSNTVINITAQNPFYLLHPLTETPIEIYFKTFDGSIKTKIDYA